MNLDTGEKLPLGMVKPAPAGTVKGLNAAAQKQQTALLNLDSGLQNYMALLQDYDPQSTDAATMAKRDKIASGFGDMRMRLKEAYELGAITGPDMTVLEGVLTDPTGLKGTLKGAAFGRDSAHSVYSAH